MDTTNIMNTAADTAAQQDGRDTLRSPYLNALVEALRAAQNSMQAHKEKIRKLQDNYKGELLLSVISEENSRHTSNIVSILDNIDRMVQTEQQTLRMQKKDDILNTGTDNEILAKIDRMDGLLTEDELQMIADTYCRSELVQRKCSHTAKKYGLHISTYPSTDDRIRTVAETAEQIKNLIQSDSFGLETEIYLKMGMPEADDILVHKEREESRL
ncbi:MAG: hypothetical protein NC254_13095 [bacterium]|nr:hypothetical protein [bacterium]